MAMKLTKSEKCALIICIVFLALSLGFALGQREQESTFVVTESSFSAETAAITESGRPLPVTAKVNINTASAAELETLEGIGPVLAQRIIDYREAEGGFKAIEDITKVRGIGAAVFEDVREHISVD